MKNPASLAALVEAVELAEATLTRDIIERVAVPSRRVEGTSQPVSRPAVPSPADEPMPTEPVNSTARAWLAGCIVHWSLPSGAPSHRVKLEGKTITAVLDTGSSVTLVQPDLIKPRVGSKATIPITCVHGDTRYVPAQRITIAAGNGAWPLEVGIVADLPVPLLLGQDWPGFEELLSLPAVSLPQTRSRPRARTQRDRQPALLASERPRG